MKRAARRPLLALEHLEDRANPVSFTAGDSGWTGSNAMSIAFGEINGDGKIDMAVGTASGIEIYTNDGTGDFTKIGNVTGTGFPEQMELVDLTGDGLADILTGLSFAHWVAVVPNNGDGTFGAPILKDLGVSVQDVDAGDFNGDGKLDVVAAVPGGAAILLNNGTTSILGSPTYYNSTGATDAAWVAVGDFNGDAKTDFAVSLMFLQRVDVYLNNGTGAFTSTSYANPVANDTGDLLAGDFNNDGHLDLAVSYIYTGMIGMMRGNGDGTFQTATITHSGNSSSGPLDAADFDLDGNLDLVTMNGGGGDEIVLPGNGDGTFASAVPVFYAYPGDVAAVDVNGDGLPDLGTGHDLSPGMFNIFLNTTEVSPPPTAASTAAASSATPAPARGRAADRRRLWQPGAPALDGGRWLGHSLSAQCRAVRPLRRRLHRRGRFRQSRPAALDRSQWMADIDQRECPEGSCLRRWHDGGG